MIKNSNRFRAIIFDIDNTLYSNIMMLLRTPLRYVFSVKWVYQYYCMRKKLRKTLSRVEKKDKELFEKLSVELFMEQTGLSQSLSNYILNHKIKDMWINGLKKTPLRMGMRKLIYDLYNHNYKLGIVSDFMAYDKLENWGLLPYFQSIVSSDQYGYFKPDDFLFNTAANELQIANNDCLYIGNHVLYDGYGALYANMDCLIFSSFFNRIQNKEYKSIHFIRSIEDIYHYLNLS